MINIRMNNVDHSSKAKLSPNIKVVGIGGAGGNAVSNMIATNLHGVDFVVCNTDAQALIGNPAEHKVQLGTALTEGLGAGAKPEIGRAAAEESLDDVMRHLEDANMVFITAGMGGGTGTGAAAVIARACRERGILTVGVVTKPFHFEGTRRMRMAEEGLSELQNYVDTLIVIPNQNLFRVVNDKTTFSDGFKMADSVLQSAVRGVTDLIVMPGLINLDFADIRSVMQEMGKAVMGAGEATGDNRATEAAEKAISNPLLDDVSMKGARGVIVNITGGYDMTLFEVDEACNRIRDEVDPDANIIFGSTFDESMEGTIRVSVVATGIDAAAADKKTVPQGKGLIGGFSVERRPVSVSRPINQPVSQSVRQEIRSEYRPVQETPVSGPVSDGVASFDLPAQQPSYAAESQQDVAPVRAAAFAGTRGTRMGESFIPPQPVEIEGGYASDLYQHPQSTHQGMFQSAPQQHHQAPVSSGVSSGYADVAPQAAVQPRKKSPSLFERITSGYRRMDTGADQFADPAPYAEQSQPQHSQHAYPVEPSASQQQSPAPSAGFGLRAPQRAVAPSPAQGRLNIDSPAAKAEEDELDIPAFLRRQTS